MNIQFNFASNVPNAARAALQTAAANWAATIHTPITLSIDVNFGNVSGGDIFASTTPVYASIDYDNVRAHMIAGEQQNDTYLSQLPTFAQLQASLPDTTYTLSSTMKVTRAEGLATGVQLLPTSYYTVRGQQHDPDRRHDQLQPAEASFDYSGRRHYGGHG